MELGRSTHSLTRPTGLGSALPLLILHLRGAAHFSPSAEPLPKQFLDCYSLLNAKLSVLRAQQDVNEKVPS